MEIKTNQELSQAVEIAIEESGYKRGYIADQIGIANQNLKKFITKKNLSLDEANQILNVLGYNAEISIKKH